MLPSFKDKSTKFYLFPQCTKYLQFFPSIERIYSFTSLNGNVMFHRRKRTGRVRNVMDCAVKFAFGLAKACRNEGFPLFSIVFKVSVVVLLDKLARDVTH